MESLFVCIELIPVSGEEFSAKCRLRPNSKIFEGHFPGDPLVPGVTMLRLIRNLASQAAKRELELSEAGNIKFTSPVIPSEEGILEVKFSLQEISDSEWNVSAQIIYNGKIASIMEKLSFRNVETTR